MRDLRELILQRLKAILDGVDGARTVWRDRDDVPPDGTPTLILLDGRERKLTATAGGGRRRMPLVEMELTPQVWIQIQPRTDVTNPGVGEELSGWRQKILSAVFNDGELAGLQGENGQLQYLGCQTDMEIGSDVIGNMLVDISLTYLFDPDDMT